MNRNKKTVRCELPPRSGVVTVWIIGAAPVFLVVLVLVTDIANVWLARVELKNAVEAGALGGAKVWGDTGNNGDARTAAQNFTQTNRVVGMMFPAAEPNQNTNNANCPGDILLGEVTDGDGDGEFDFNAIANDSVADPPPDRRGVLVHAEIEIDSLWMGFGGPHPIQATATAKFDSADDSVRIIRLEPGDDVCN